MKRSSAALALVSTASVLIVSFHNCTSFSSPAAAPVTELQSTSINHLPPLTQPTAIPEVTPTPEPLLESKLVFNKLQDVDLPSCIESSSSELTISTYEYKALYSEPLQRNIHLRAYVVRPKQLSAKRPVVAFFHGGGWSRENPMRYLGAAMYAASRGLVAVTFQYRLWEVHGSSRTDAVADARTAIRWLRKNADALHVDSNRITTVGDSAGGHLALNTSLGTTVSDERGTSDETISSAANGQFLLYPVASLERKICTMDVNQFDLAISPSLLPGPMPPTWILHGDQDTCTPLADSKALCDRFGQNCRLITFENAGHAFFSFPENHARSMILLEDFLQQSGSLAAVSGQTPEDTFRSSGVACTYQDLTLENQRGLDWGYEDMATGYVKGAPRRSIW